jgi:predicted lipoprotein with Yx(FWY)xxD motif
MRYGKRFFTLLAVPALILALAGTALAQDYNYNLPAKAPAGQSGATVKVQMSSKVGPYLTDSEGMTLYMFKNDKTQNESTCTGKCATAWPAFTATGAVSLPSGVSGTLTTFKRSDDGKMQVSYNGIPLYHFAKDTKAGDMNGQGIGDVWYVVTPGMTFGEDPEKAEAAAMASPEASPMASPAASPAAEMGGATVMVRQDAKLGPILTDANGMTLYLFTNDKTKDQSSCTGGCATAWPAFTATGAVSLPSGVSGTLTTFKRSDDGKMQVAYNGIPLYHYSGDTKPGDTNGQEVGNVWYVVAPGTQFGASH